VACWINSNCVPLVSLESGAHKGDTKGTRKYVEGHKGDKFELIQHTTCYNMLARNSWTRFHFHFVRCLVCMIVFCVCSCLSYFVVKVGQVVLGTVYTATVPTVHNAIWRSNSMAMDTDCINIGSVSAARAVQCPYLVILHRTCTLPAHIWIGIRKIILTFLKLLFEKLWLDRRLSFYFIYLPVLPRPGTPLLAISLID